MFGLSIWEIFLILVIALLVVGPERLPGLARTVGSWVYKVKRFVANAKAEMDSEFNLKDMQNLLTSQESEIAKLRALVEETRQEVSDSGRQVLGAVDEAEASFRAAAASEQSLEADTAAKAASEETAAETTGAATDRSTQGDAPAQAEQAAPDKPMTFEEEIRALEESSGQTFKRPFEPMPEPSAAEPTQDAPSPNTRNTKST